MHIQLWRQGSLGTGSVNETKKNPLHASSHTRIETKLNLPASKETVEDLETAGESSGFPRRHDLEDHLARRLDLALGEDRDDVLEKGHGVQESVDIAATGIGLQGGDTVLGYVGCSWVNAFEILVLHEPVATVYGSWSNSYLFQPFFKSFFGSKFISYQPLMILFYEFCGLLMLKIAK